MAVTFAKYILIMLGFLLLGYACLGKGFAYLGISPIYIGEIVLGLGMLGVVFSGGLGQAWRSPLTKLLILYMVWWAICTVPFIKEYGLNALRDGVIWGYGSFAILVAAAILRSGSLRETLTRYARIIPWVLLWWPLALYLQFYASQILPVTGSNASEPIKLIYLNSSEISSQLGGIAAFLLLGLRQIFQKTGAASWLTDSICWVAWTISAVIVASISRGAFLALAAALLLILLLKRFELGQRLALFIICLSVVLIAGFITGASIDPGSWTGREINLSQIAANITSITGGSSRGDLEGTREWRLSWWNDIVDYTFFGNYFWQGKGFGYNLYEDYGSVDEASLTLRSPHNANLTILARSGVPGLAIWVVLQGVFGIMLLRAFSRAQRLGQKGFAGVNLFILAYWLAFMVNSSFDVFLEGPQGGIWFWCLFGTGIAVLEIQRTLSLKNMR